MPPPKNASWAEITFSNPQASIAPLRMSKAQPMRIPHLPRVFIPSVGVAHPPARSVPAGVRPTRRTPHRIASAAMMRLVMKP